MRVVSDRCAGLDVHKKSVTACLLLGADRSDPVSKVRTFSTMTAGLLALLDWLEDASVTHAAMESTGEYWKPVYNILEGHFELLVVNAAHIKNVPGRKTDTKDCEWIAELLRHGLLRASFVPPVEQRDLRDLTRHRSNFIRERATVVNRVQKLLEGANIKLASVATDVLGVSGRDMLEGIAGGETEVGVLAAMARGRLKSKAEELELALTGLVRPHHRLILQQLLRHIDSLDACIDALGAEIEVRCRPFEETVENLDTIPGVARETAQLIASEVGLDMSRFPTAGHLAAWAGVAPGNNESGGKRLSGRTRHGNAALRKGLVTAAHAAAHTKSTYLSAQYRRLAARRGKKRAIMAVAHSILVIAYHIIDTREPYRDLGGNYFDERRPEATRDRLIDRLAKLGYYVTLEPAHAATAA
jgi:transposase